VSPLAVFLYVFVGLLVYLPVGPDVYLMARARAMGRFPVGAWMAVVLAYAAALSVAYAVGAAGRKALRRDLGRWERWIRRYGGWASFLAAVSPVPLREFALVAGYCRMAYPVFLTGILAGVILRFTLECTVSLMW